MASLGWLKALYDSCLSPWVAVMAEEFVWIFSYGFWEGRLFDLPNFFICFVLVLSLGRLLGAPALVQLLLLAHCALPFFLNGVLFDYEYMPDQFKYWVWFNQIRDGQLSFADAIVGGNTQQAAVFFALMPFPSAVAPLSLGFFSAFLYVCLFYWLYAKKVFTNFSMWFFLLYPSMALYSGLALREGFILVFMMVAVQLSREGRWVGAALFLVPLYLIKFQNFYILAPILAVYLLLGVRRSGISLLNGAVLAFLSFGALLLSAPFALPLVNKFRFAMFVEDGGDPMDIDLIASPMDFVGRGFTSAFYFFAKPWPWEATSAMQMIQSFENLIVVAFLFFVTKIAWRNSPRRLVFWGFFMLLSMSVYGLVVANFGTAARYRYPFVVIYVVFVCIECQVYSVLPSVKRYQSKFFTGSK